ncbi:MAG: hypothetical protein CMJ18_10725 [Phycisphaeraceae bacterium]|nr:hypothetical protein [Phycisphaeraceae bacterium]
MLRIVLCAWLTLLASLATAEPLLLARDAATPYAIVIAREPLEAEKIAAKELAHFLHEITGADFPIRADDEPATEHEVVLGSTNRLGMDDVPDSLKSDRWEGFTILRRGHRVFIMGNLPRATLYGVYDLVDVELGVRFLTSEATHVPKRPTLEFDVTSRHYGPIIEYRAIWEAALAPAAVRNRMNGIGFQIANARTLGGIRWVGRPVHTFDSFVPVGDYFDEHPEYFSLIDGRRRKHPSQLCLTNADVYRMTMAKIRDWTEGAKDDPYTKYVVSVTPNDHDHHCECEPCSALNRKAGVPVTGALIWFVNRVAREIAAERPNVLVETLAYQQYEQPPQGIELHPNVMIRFAPIGMDFGRRLDDPDSDRNRRALRNLKDWSRISRQQQVRRSPFPFVRCGGPVRLGIRQHQLRGRPREVGQHAAGRRDATAGDVVLLLAARSRPFRRDPAPGTAGGC